MQAEISIVMPLYNEERYVASCLDSLLQQDYPRDKMHWYLVDGHSEDGTRRILADYEATYPDLITVLENPNRTVPYAMNLGIQAAQGDYLIRLDAHTEYPKDYLSQCVAVLEETGAQNVGGPVETRAKTEVGELIADVLSSPFGVGNSSFRTGGQDGYVDTVPFGAFPRSLFDEIGGYDVRFSRNEDNELNERIRQHGGKVYLSSKIHSAYYCRDSVSSLMQQAYQNGRWNMVSMRLAPESMGVRHLVPLAFLLSLVILPLLALAYRSVLYLLVAELMLYLGLSVYAATKGKRTSPWDVFRKVWIFPVYHLSYGWGSLSNLGGKHV